MAKTVGGAGHNARKAAPKKKPAKPVKKAAPAKVSYNLADPAAAKAAKGKAGAKAARPTKKVAALKMPKVVKRKTTTIPPPKPPAKKKAAPKPEAKAAPEAAHDPAAEPEPVESGQAECAPDAEAAKAAEPSGDPDDNPDAPEPDADPTLHEVPFDYLPPGREAETGIDFADEVMAAQGSLADADAPEPIGLDDDREEGAEGGKPADLNEEHYSFIKATVTTTADDADDGDGKDDKPARDELRLSYRLNGSEVVGGMDHDDDVAGWPDRDIERMVRQLLDVDGDDPVKIEIVRD